MTYRLPFTHITATTPPRLCKVLSLDAAGALVKSPAATMAHGIAVSASAASLRDLAKHLDDLAPSQAVTWGGMGQDFAVIVKKDELPNHPGAVARSREHFAFPEGPGVLMLDHDDMPPGRMPCASADAFRAMLAEVCPALAAAPMLIRPSSGAGVVRADGSPVTGLHKWRAYVPVQDAREIPEAGKRLGVLAWARRFGWAHVSKSGAMLDATVLDGAVWQPERLDFAAAPELHSGLRRPYVAPAFFNEHAPLFDLALVAPTAADSGAAQTLQAMARAAQQAHAAEVRAAWAKDRAPAVAQRTGRPVADVEAALTRASATLELTPDFPLEFQHLGLCTVRDVLTDPQRFHRQRLVDPLDPGYQQDPRVAVCYTDRDVFLIRSHARGETTYKLVRDAEMMFGVVPPLPGVVPVPPTPPAPPHREQLSERTPADSAAQFAADYYEQTRLKEWQGVFYRWRCGAWQEASEADIRAQMYRFIEGRHQHDFRATRDRVSKIIDALRSGVHLEDLAVNPPCWLVTPGHAPADEIVACENGLLHLPTGTLHTATPEFFNLNALPVAFDPGAPSPRAWLAFLAQVWPDDPEAIAALQELFGYLLTPDTSQQKVFLIVGPKRSGKGTIARVLTALLGAANVASPTLGSMSGDFGLQSLVGKLAAVLSDARLSGRADQKEVAENLLRISGEDQVEVNRKFLKPLALRLGVRFVLLTNELPKIADASGAMASRFVILTMAHSFFGREDPGLTARLMAELSGIFRWAVEGWHRLRARGYFVPPKSSAAAVQELADLGSPIGAFVREACTQGAGAEVGVDQLFTAWRVWCADQGVERAGTKAQFGRDLNAAVPGLNITQPRVDGDRVRVYVGLGLRTGTRWHTCQAIAAPQPF